MINGATVEGDIEVADCRSCGTAPLAPILDLGVQPLANDLRAPSDGTPLERFPLRLALCEACALVQLTVSVPPDKMFTEYPYFSSISDAVVRHAEENVEAVLRTESLGDSALVMEIGSNDGYLLQHYRRRGINVLGIEPAQNIAEVAVDHGVSTVCEYFSRDLANRLEAEGVQADIIHANNVLAHIPDINGVMAGIAVLLKERGRLILETPYLLDLVDQCEFDTIYHEHLFYYSVTALKSLLERHGLTVVDVQHLDIHGGSLRVTAARATDVPAHGAVVELLGIEKARGFTRWDAYAEFALRVRTLGRSLRTMLEDLVASGARVAAYGAAAKGATLLNTFGLGTPLIEYVVDRSPHKQGLVMPGSGLRIYPVEQLLSDVPDYVLMLSWNHAPEILAQQAEFRSRGGRFIVPVPAPRVV